MKIESQCIVHLIGHARKDLKIFGQKAKPKHRHGSNQNPSMLVFYKYGYPRILFGETPTDENVATVGIVPLTSDFHDRIAKAGGKYQLNFRHGGGFHADLFARMLAKIGHSFATYRHGRDSFYPLTRGLIRGIGPQHAQHYVGTDVISLPAATERFVLTSTWENPPHQSNNEYLLVRIRLFAEYSGSPTYVVVGSNAPGNLPY